MRGLAKFIRIGMQCARCLDVFEGAHYQPVLCPDCWDEMTEEERRQYPRATECVSQPSTTQRP